MLPVTRSVSDDNWFPICILPAFEYESVICLESKKLAFLWFVGSLHNPTSIFIDQDLRTASRRQCSWVRPYLSSSSNVSITPQTTSPHIKESQLFTQKSHPYWQATTASSSASSPSESWCRRQDYLSYLINNRSRSFRMNISLSCEPRYSRCRRVNEAAKLVGWLVGWLMEWVIECFFSKSSPLYMRDVTE